MVASTRGRHCGRREAGTALAHSLIFKTERYAPRAIHSDHMLMPKLGAAFLVEVEGVFASFFGNDLSRIYGSFA